MSKQTSAPSKVNLTKKTNSVLNWPLRKFLSYSLENPLLLERATLFVHRFPILFNWLLKFAQTHEIVMDAEEPCPAFEEVHSVSELTSDARHIYDALRTAFADRVD